MKMYKCKQNFSYAEAKYFKGELYDEFPPKYAWAFEEIKKDSPKKEIKVSAEKVETAAKKPKAEKR